MEGFCNRCGKCCESIGVREDAHYFLWHRIIEASEGKEEGDSAFISKHWRQGPDGYYTCAKYDRSRNLCGAHDDRPDVCSDYPWYGREPKPMESMNSQCSYLWDFPVAERPKGSKPLLPIVAVS